MKIKSISKYAVVFLAGALFATAGSAYGADVIKSINAKLRPDLKISVNGEKIDAPAISYNNTTYLPLRKISDAIGGKIQLNGTNINIVTGSADANKSGETIPKSSEKVGDGSANKDSYSIEGKILYEWADIYNSLRKSGRPQMTGGVVNGNFTVTFENNKYIRIRNVDYYYDIENDKDYLSRDFLLKFLQSTDLDGLTQYAVKKDIVSPI